MHKTRLLQVMVFGLIINVAVATQSQPENTSAPKQPAAAATAVASDELPIEQGRLADRYKRLEEVIGRLAELSTSADPRRAKLLREAIAQSREQDINVRFEAIVKLLEDERLSVAATNQTELQQELDQLLTLLLKADRDNELSSQRDRVRRYLKEVARLIRMQKGVRARTEGGDELKPLSTDQERIAADTGKLGGDISKTEGDQNRKSEAGSENDKQDAGDESSGDEKSDAEKNKPSDSDSNKPGDESKPGESSKPGTPSDSPAAEAPKSQPSEGQSGEGNPSKPSDAPPSQPSQSQGQPGQPSPGEGKNSEQPPAPQDPADRAAKRLRAAQQQMEQAIKKLDEAERKGAANQQREALRALEQAKADLERVLRQLREEELERTLTQLAARFKKMLEWQIEVHEGTIRVSDVPLDDRDHDDEIEAARLSRREAEIMREADKALLLLREEGSSVAFPETVEQIRDDMRQVVEWLAAMKVGKMTQGVEEDIIAALEETIAALEKAMKDMEKNRTRPGQQPSPGQPTEPPLVDKLSELKMIRALQMRINKRTQRYGDMIEGEQAETADLIEALKELAERQESVHRATADLEQGRND